MKILQLSLLSISIINFSFNSLAVSYPYTYELNSSKVVQNFLIVDNYQSQKVFGLKFLSDINQETAAKIDAFVSSRLGVISSSTNFTTKVISITVDERLGKNEVDFIFNSVRKKFLGPEDAPQHVNCKH